MTDGTENNVTDMAGKYQQIKYYKNSTNLGAYKSRNLMSDTNDVQKVCAIRWKIEEFHARNQTINRNRVKSRVGKLGFKEIMLLALYLYG